METLRTIARTAVLLALFIASLAPAAQAAEPPVKIRLVTPYTEFTTGKSYPVLLELSIKEGYHINSNKPLDPALIATVARFSSPDPNVTIGRITYPEPVLKKFKLAEQKLSVYEGTVYLSTSISVSQEAKSQFTVKAHLDYQACTESACLIPAEADVEPQLMVGTAGTPLDTELFSKSAPQADGDVFASMKGGVGMTALFLVFLGGLALNLTPCVYPMIPVTIGFFGAATGRSRRETAFHALIYLLGMALMYSTLGVVAALTGSLFGSLMQNTVVVLLLVATMLALAASMFGAFEIMMPQSLLNLSSKSYGGYFGTLFMGATVGILAAPCVGPFVIGLLTFVGGRQDPVLGFTLFFVLALGLGLPLVALALFSGSIANLPRSGAWMVWVRKVFGVVLVGMAVYFARPIITDEALFRYLSVAVSVVGGFYLILTGRGTGGRLFAAVRYGIGILIIAFGVWLAAPSATAKHEGLHFNDYSKQAFQTARQNKRAVLLDFTADWCLPCRELKLFTFTDPRVTQRAGEFEAMAIDLTKVDDAKLQAKKDFNVLGVPTVILVNGDGTEVSRFTGFVTADEFLQKLDRLKQPAQ